MIEFRTGLPGAGKTLAAIHHYKAIAERDNRPIYYYGIKELVLPWIELEDPTKWFEVEANSIVIIDEAQKVFRPGPSSQAVPIYMQKAEDHRHGGIDLVLITQQPMLVHKHMRELSGHHLHFVRIFGLERAKVHEWDVVVDNPRVQRKDSRSTTFYFPREAYLYYKSAEAHTHKRNVPKRVFLLFLIPFFVAACLYFGYQYLKPFWQKKEAAPAVASAAPNAAPGATAASPAQTAAMSRLEWLERQKPRVDGLPHTAPMYDSVTQSVVAPFPAACVKFKGVCKCYSQQATVIATDPEICLRIVQSGYFVSWDTSGKRREDKQQPDDTRAGTASRQ